MAYQLVWFKKDLRFQDHAPLWQASQAGPYIGLYVYEPEWFASPEFDSSHLVFVNQSLEKLRQAFAARGGQLLIRHGSIPEVLDSLHAEFPFETLWSHEETGNDLTYQRDIRVGHWAKQKGIRWIEISQNGVVRRLKSRDGWANLWEQRMAAAQALTPSRFEPTPPLPAGEILSPESLGLPPNTKLAMQQGGENQAWQELMSFLETRGAHYQQAMSSPVSAWDQCSRLSPYITWGNLSIKQIVQALRNRIALLRGMKPASVETQRWLASLRSFEKRLHWHCHFMQKLEDQPALEFQNACRAFDGLRENQFNTDLFEAWCQGQTGYPMIDACMRCLHETGWINFRMRAMLASFAAYHLWLHWRPTAVYLAQHFLDFEPGIHFSQFQMQSGVTGINTIRIYSPAKQALEQDPDGIFIRKYIPELATLPTEYIHAPETLPPLLALSYGFQLGRDYPAPVVDHATAYKKAQQAIFEIKKRPETRRMAQQVYEKHGSRNSQTNRPRKR